MKKILITTISFLSLIGYCQTTTSSETEKTTQTVQKKSLQTKFITEPIVIDGKETETIWQTAEIAKDFIMFQPDNGKPMSESQKTEVKVLYNNDAIYVSAKMYDSEGKVLTENTARDVFGASDIFGAFFNGYNDGQGDFRFFSTAGNTQLDASATEGTGEDYSWDAVWESKAVLTDYGWSVEMRIPYSALRFSNEKKQTWGLQFFRMIKRENQKFTWNFVDSKINNFGGQFGILNGLESIKTPTRLFLLPYISQYFNADAENKTKGTLKGGLDIKYGINDAFTLDVILIPDFGQTAVDQQILNLGPFEQQFQERRAFFTEGTDLFSKGNLVYSRRIGGRPTGKATLATNEKYETPVAQNVALLNALKISGRTKEGLGIGILNAVTENTYANIINTVTGTSRQELIEPITNFSVLVFDQRFRKNSSVSFVNTNVTRDGNFRDANVSALGWDLKTKANSFGLNGYFKYSFVNNNGKKDGINTGLEFNKISGKWRAGIGGDVYGKHYDPNDLGINFQTNFYDFYTNVSYRILKPIKNFNNLGTYFNFYNEIHKETGDLMSSNINWNFNATTKKNNSIGTGLNINPFKTHEYDPRIGLNGSVINPQKIELWTYYSSNYNKKFAFDTNPYYDYYYEKGRINYGISGGLRFRLNDKVLFSCNSSFDKRENDNGFYDKNGSDVVFAYRNILSYSNSFTAKYAPNAKTTFNMSIQHYWSYVENKKALLLDSSGNLSDYTIPYPIDDEDFSNWNLDLSYSWWFAEGSQMSILYRNNSSNYESDINRNFGKNIDNLLNNRSLSHVFSISVKYFIDYNKAKKWF